jgi:dTDP-4-dehydrorhamnose reductase
MRLLITGVSGLLGLNLALEAMREHAIVGVDRDTLASAPFPILQADLLDREAAERVVADARPDAIIHCAALADIDACEANPELAHRTNAVIPRHLAGVCSRSGIRFLHISTDAVFSGRDSGPYVEEDQPDPLGVYAITKLEGERAVLRSYPAASVLRVNFYGWSLTGRRSLAEFFVNRLSEGSNVNGFTDVTFCPMFVGDLARLLLTVAGRDLPGVYHLVGPQAMTKYQFGVEIAHRFGLRAGLIAPQSVERSSLTAKRSHNLWLSTHKISTALQQELPDFSTGLQAFSDQYQQGYPQKIRSYQQAAKAAQAGA